MKTNEATDRSDFHKREMVSECCGARVQVTLERITIHVGTQIVWSCNKCDILGVWVNPVNPYREGGKVGDR